MTSRATAAGVGAAFNVWVRTLGSKGAHTDGLKLKRESDVWRIVGASDTTPIPCGDTRGFLGDSTRSALDALRRSTTQLGMLPAEHTVQGDLLPWVALFNESEIEGCREDARRRLQAMTPGQFSSMRAINLPTDEAIVLFEEERYKIETDMMPLAEVASGARMPVRFRHIESGEMVRKMLNRVHRLRVTSDPLIKG